MLFYVYFDRTWGYIITEVRNLRNKLKTAARSGLLALGLFFCANCGVSQAAQAQPYLRTYIAQPGDNFQMLGQRVGYDPGLLAALNNRGEGFCCRGGEELKIPREPATAQPAATRSSQVASRSARERAGGSGGRIWQQPLGTPGQVTSAFASRRESSGPHHGLDIAVPAGEPILAAHGGTVVEAGWKNSVYGLAVVVDHGNGWQTLYAHCSKVLVKPGEQVEQGEQLALVGSTGNSTGPHLHLELHKDGVWLDPARYFGDFEV